MRELEQDVRVSVRGGVTAPMRARRAADRALARLVHCDARVRAAVADLVSELATAAVRHGRAANCDTELEVVLERRGGRLRVTVRDRCAAPFALLGAALHVPVAACGTETHGAWAELQLG